MSEEKTQQQRIQALLNCLQQTIDDEADCIEFDAEMDCIAEWLADGADPATVVKPRVNAHLNNSPDCSEEFNSLVAILRAEQAGLLDTDEDT